MRALIRHATQFLRAYCRSAWCQPFIDSQNNWLASQLKRQFGYFALQIGNAYSLQSAWEKCPIACKTVLSEDKETNSHLIGYWDDLPIRDDSLDLVLLLHSIEVIKDPYALLREVERVLIADGRIIVVGFEPKNAWRGKWFGHHKQGIQHLNFYGAGRVVDWLQALGFEIENVHFFPNQGWRKWLPWLSTPCTQGYAIIAHKTTARVRLIGLRDGWRWQSLLPQLARRNMIEKRQHETH